MSERQRQGKIARLPAAIREEVNQRLHDGQTGSQILPWLHSLPEVLRVLDELFKEEPITPQNLSEWRTGGYQDWLRQRERVENLKTLSTYAGQLAQAGGSLTEGAAAIAGGKILDLIESLDEDNIQKLISSLAALRSSEAAALNAKTNKAKLAQKDRELSLAEATFRRQTAETFIKWLESEEARQIASGSEPKRVRVDKLVQLMFGDRPQEAQ
jgi:hypothetical protein